MSETPPSGRSCESETGRGNVSVASRFFVNRGQTDNRWELKRHALPAFYRALSHWCIFLTNPATYGWRDNCESIPPIKIHIHDVTLTAGQRDAVQRETGELFVCSPGGITKRSKLSQIGKGNYDGQAVATEKPGGAAHGGEPLSDQRRLIGSGERGRVGLRSAGTALLRHFLTDFSPL